MRKVKTISTFVFPIMEKGKPVSEAELHEGLEKLVTALNDSYEVLSIAPIVAGDNIGWAVLLVLYA